MNLRDEDALTERLFAFLKTSPECLREFLAMLTGSHRIAASWMNGAVIKMQYEVDVGLIDLLIVNGEDAIIIENKVEDTPKVYQLLKYREWWIREHGNIPKVYWILRRRTKMLGEEGVLDGVLLWDDLFENLQASPDIFSSRRSKDASRIFLRYLKENGILLKVGEKRIRNRKSKGFDRERSEALLQRIRKAFSGTESHPEEVNELPSGLWLGRTRWKACFGDGWIQRVAIFYWTDRTLSPSPFFLPQILFFHKHKAIPATYALNHYQQWASICASDKMEFWRNKPGKWKGNHNLKLEYPFVIELPVWFFFAQCPMAEAAKRWMIPESIDSAANIGVKCAEHYLALVDRFVENT